MNPILIILRIILPIALIPKWPLFGGVVAIFLDNIDWGTKHIFGIEPLFEYQSIDKILDTFYLAMLAISSLNWKDKLARNVSIFLFMYRLVGVIIFEITHVRFFLFLFPNIFENFFFSYLLISFFSRYNFRLTNLFLPVMLIIISVPKMLQEYSIHIVQHNLIFNFFGLQLEYKGTWMQILYIIVFCMISGLIIKRGASKPKIHA